MEVKKNPPLLFPEQESHGNQNASRRLIKRIIGAIKVKMASQI